ncbi:hypothetical protein CY34DRAFT_785198, partial [Suillus luteus UH-Slu-Lm8-n1]
MSSSACSKQASTGMNPSMRQGTRRRLPLCSAPSLASAGVRLISSAHSFSPWYLNRSCRARESDYIDEEVRVGAFSSRLCSVLSFISTSVRGAAKGWMRTP